MRRLRSLASAAAVLAATLCAAESARADQMDPAIERLTKPFVYKDASGNSITVNDPTTGQPTCTKGPGRQFYGNVTPTIVVGCAPDNVAFARLINQYAMAIAPNAMHSARTTGYGSFHLSIEGAYTTIDNGADYWKNGTQGPQNPVSKNFSIRNESPSSMLQVYSLKVRKGFPFGLEVGAQVGYLYQSSIVTGGADIRMSLLEGFRKGALGILPDIAVGGGVRTISGTPEFNLTVVGVDAQISKQLPIADSSILTPYVGYQYLWIFGDSGLVSPSPNTDPLGYCGYRGPNVPGNPDPGDPAAKRPGKGFYDGQPVCSNGGSPLAFNNAVVFDNVRLVRQRFIIGMNYRYELLFIGGQFMTDVSAPEDAGGRDNKEKLAGVPRQTTLVFELGALF